MEPAVNLGNSFADQEMSNKENIMSRICLQCTLQFTALGED